MLKIGDELIENPVGTSANIIRKIATISTGYVTFDGGMSVKRREIETSGRWSKLEKLRDSRSTPEIGDTVHFRNGWQKIHLADEAFAYFESGKKVPKNEIHYDEEAGQFWFRCPQDDVLGGDIVIHGENRYKVQSVHVLHRKIIFEGGQWIDLHDLQVDSTDGTWFISPSDKINGRAKTELKSGDIVQHGLHRWMVSKVVENVVHFKAGGMIHKDKIIHDAEKGWYIEEWTKFFDMKINRTDSYILVADTCAIRLNEKINYVTNHGFKLWGPTLVKGDHYAQAMRK